MDATAAPPPRKRKHRWRQFSLRTLFVAVTSLAILCSWISYEIQRITKRNELLNRERAIVAAAEGRGMELDQFYWHMACAEPVKAPIVLRAFGEYGVSAIGVLVESPTAAALTAAERERVADAKRLFPEAFVVVVSWRPGSRVSQVLIDDSD